MKLGTRAIFPTLCAFLALAVISPAAAQRASTTDANLAECDIILATGIFDRTPSRRNDESASVFLRVTMGGGDSFSFARNKLMVPGYNIPITVRSRQRDRFKRALRNVAFDDSDFKDDLHEVIAEIGPKLLNRWDACMNRPGVNFSVEHLFDPDSFLIEFRFIGAESGSTANMDSLGIPDKRFSCGPRRPDGFTLRTGTPILFSCSRLDLNTGRPTTIVVNSTDSVVNSLARLTLPGRISDGQP